MTQMTLSEDDLLRLIETYGADLAAWPAEQAEAAARHLANPSQAVRAALDEAAALDALLAELPQVEPPVHLAAAILDAAPARKPVRKKSAGWLGWLEMPGMPARTGAAMASLFVGLGVGFGTAAANAPAPDDFDTVMSQTLELHYQSDVSDFLEPQE
jgi:hypothetical protein